MFDLSDPEMMKPEPLHPDLAPFLENWAPFPMLRHPLVFQVPYSPVFSRLTNRMYQQKLEYLQHYEQTKNWPGYIWTHERPYRLDAFVKIENQIEDNEYWSLLGDIYVDSENTDQSPDVWRDLLSSPRTGRDYLMRKTEQEKFVHLPAVMTVFRGGAPGEEIQDLSWSLSREVASWFATRFNRAGEVLTGTVKKSDVLAYFTRRGEEEIFVHAEHVMGIKVDSGLTSSDSPSL